jgi:hypothetical protein
MLPRHSQHIHTLKNYQHLTNYSSICTAIHWYKDNWYKVLAEIKLSQDDIAPAINSGEGKTTSLLSAHFRVEI